MTMFLTYLSHSLLSWYTFWRHNVFFMSWRTFWRHYILFFVMTLLWPHGVHFNILFVFESDILTLWRMFDLMSYFLTSGLICCHDLFLTSWWTFCRHDVFFDVMTKFLTSWLIYFTSWRVFVMYLWRHDLPLMSGHPFWHSDVFLISRWNLDTMTYLSTSWHYFDLKTYLLMSWRNFYVIKYFLYYNILFDACTFEWHAIHFDVMT